MLTDIRVINKMIQQMISLKPRIPLPFLLLKGWYIIVTDLKDCSFTIPFQEDDSEKFAFLYPTYNNSQYVKKYQ